MLNGFFLLIFCITYVVRFQFMNDMKEMRRNTAWIRVYVCGETNPHRPLRLKFSTQQFVVSDLGRDCHQPLKNDTDKTTFL